MKVITFGMIRDILNCMNNNDYAYITKALVNDSTLSSSDIVNMLELLISVRNIAAHDEILGTYIHRKVNIKTTTYHNLFNLKKSRTGELIEGKKDLLAVLISLKYFMETETYNELLYKFENTINKYSNKIVSINSETIMASIHMPSNFMDLENKELL